ncbi:ABC transporter ATP-binding protein [Streptomyces sp. 8L]|uniref:ABC transporter ATP-binding protein n=1 Tax=Streptomyces sp. 8L TaxID=2877242 RepID=UPI001CD731F3|nr:ATP-binding cassette domain-containing protein [Streptomyces sp. 8L]MCA1218173.1 ATP-binding cassette domain-containing protein [Streptomyces sp. 8L]
MALSGVGRRYGIRGPWVLRGVGLALAAGTVARVEGANGSGKSTLLRLLAGIDTPSAGRVTGRPRTAYVPERFAAALPFTAAAYLAHTGRVHGLARPVAEARAAEWLERFGAAAHARTPLAELSKGTSQKVAVTQALAAEPELLVLDEAWTGLDEAARAELDRAVTERAAAGGTVVFVDHDPARLAGVPDAVYSVAGSSVLRTRERAGGEGDESGDGPRVRVLVSRAAPGTEPPEGLPGHPVRERLPDGTFRLTVPAAHSDALLRALLTAHPPWHVHALHETEGRSAR